MVLELLAPEKREFWAFTSSFIILTLVNLAYCISYSLYSKKYGHMKAKDPGNFWLIFLAGQFQSWGHFIYSMPVYEKNETSVTMCLIIGYVCQHLLGSTLMFYAIVVRLIKFGAIFQSLTNCCTCFDIEPEFWTRQRYTAVLMKKYKLTVALFGVFMICPLIIFIAFVYLLDAISIDRKTLYCQTDRDWKIVFISITMFYFFLMLTMLCFIPRFIKMRVFNEGGALRDSVIFVLLVFSFEIWLNVEPRFATMPWFGLSSLLFFLIHTFVLFRLGLFRWYRAFKNDQYYETKFREEYNKNRHDNDHYIGTVISAEYSNDLTVGFLHYVSRKFPSDLVLLKSQTEFSKQNKVPVSVIVGFLLSAMELAKVMKDAPAGEGAAHYPKYQSLVETYIRTGVIPCTQKEIDAYCAVGTEELNPYTLRKLIAYLVSTLYGIYFQRFSETDEICQIDPEMRKKRSTMAGYSSLVGNAEDYYAMPQFTIEDS